ncbi:MAG: hypothetical protein M3327_10805 [Actinomycetota bacterium]|nr:hypothetical protein [Actinomycetota bacterium]
MTTASLGSGTVDAYREEADRFLAELDEEHYVHFAGHKASLDLAPVYDRHADLFTPDAYRGLDAAARDGLATAELRRFAAEGYIGQRTRAAREDIARLEASLSATVDGEEVPYRLFRTAVANEPDRVRRDRLESTRAELAEEHLNPLHAHVLELMHEGAGELGAATYRELYEGFGYPLADLAAECERLLVATEDVYVRSMTALFRARLGMTLEEARRPDVLRLFRAADWDAGFRAAAMLPALTGTLGELGIDLANQPNVHLDVEPRPQKTPRAFCAPIEVPGRVILVIQPMGGPDDWHALFHEAGHTEHFAHTSADLPFEARRLGDNALTEGWATLLELLVDDPVWLARRLDFGRPHDFAGEAATVRLYLVRRYAAKLLYELELHADGDLDPMRERYSEVLADATKIEPSKTDFLSDVDDGFYVTNYLRSWAFEAQIRAFLREEFGSAWFSRREAGSLLRELWHEGQRLSADELLREVTGGNLQLESVIERSAEPLRL